MVFVATRLGHSCENFITFYDYCYLILVECFRKVSNNVFYCVWVDTESKIYSLETFPESDFSSFLLVSEKPFENMMENFAFCLFLCWGGNEPEKK